MDEREPLAPNPRNLYLPSRCHDSASVRVLQEDT
jgi:hypothetical protein